MTKIRQGIDYIGIDDNSSSDEYVFKKINIGDWDMTSTFFKSVAHNLSSTEWKTIINVNGIIRNDADNNYSPIKSGGIASWTAGNEPADCFIWNFGSTNISLYNLTGGTFDNASYNATSYNRGHLFLKYKPD